VRRAAVLRPGDADARALAARLATELRARRCMAIEIDTDRSDPFGDAYEEWSRAAESSATTSPSPSGATIHPQRPSAW
jgi:hypothetical protein